jgi:hypothetical protein
MVENNPPIDKVYHYTSITGLYGILSSKCLWLTEHSYLRDFTEVIHGLKRLFCALDAQRPNAFADYVCGSVYQKGILAIISRVSYHTFVFSFSEDGDSKSQWQEYANAYKGVCLSFNYDKLYSKVFEHRRLVTFQGTDHTIKYAEPAYFSRAIYDDSAKAEIVDRIVRKAIELAASECEGVSTDERNKIFQDVFTNALYVLLKLFAVFKDSSFAAERERRIVIQLPIGQPFGVKGDLAGIEYRIIRDKLVPYYPMDLEDLDGVISGISVGPTYGDDYVEFTMKEFLHKMGIGYANISRSKVPVR